MWFHLGAVLILACCRAQCSPAFAGGLSKPIMPVDISRFNPPPPTEAGDPAAAAADVGCPETDGTIPLYVPDPDSCTKYTVCSGPFGMQMECPPGMHFSVKTSSCTFPPLANCPLLENATETISLTDLKGAPGIDATAYPAGIPSQDSMKSGPAGNMGQLPQLQASAPLSTPDSGLLTAEKKKELGNGLRAAISGFLSAGDKTKKEGTVGSAAEAA